MKTKLKQNSSIYNLQLTFFFGFILVCISNLTFCQPAINSQKAKTTEMKYGENIKLVMNEEVQFEDGLSITLTYFSHKHPYPDGPTSGSAYIVLSKDEISDEQSLSTYQESGETEVEYDDLLWNGYHFQLLAFDYDESIEVVVTKSQAKTE